MKYRFKSHDGTVHDETVEDTWRRIAHALASVEKDAAHWEGVFYDALEDWKFLPAGRITAGAGTNRSGVTLFNCLSGDTEILTSEYGVVQIGEVAGEIVHVLDGNGDWVKAPINAFGVQNVYEVTLKGGYNGRVKKSVKATEGHRWICADGSEVNTSDLTNGSKLKFVNRKENSGKDYVLGVQHGVVYGDGAKGYKDKFQLRLCGDKSTLSWAFDGWRYTYPPSCNGDPVYQGTNGRDMKSLPLEGESADYIAGFIHGWFATDGCVCKRDKKPILSCGFDGVEWIKRFGAIGGLEYTYITKLQESTNYGDRNNSVYNVGFSRSTAQKSDFLLPKHCDRFSKAEYEWEVVSVDYFGEEDVYCPSVETTASFQLTGGVHTGNCFVMGTIPDSLSGIFDMLKEAALTMQQGGGIGYDFSTLRPQGAQVKGVDSDASGPLSFMDVWDAMCRTIMSAGGRRGAMMATMRCDHPDIEKFITAKREAGRLRHFNVSVLVTDKFMDAVKEDAIWCLQFDGTVYSYVRARDLWNLIMENTYSHAEPGVIFIDRINERNPLKYCETIAATNPCGEQALPPYGACLLGSINLVKFVRHGEFDVEEIYRIVQVAVRMMDNTIDVSNFPLSQQKAEAIAKRRIGLGVTGLADALAMMGIEYGSEEALHVTEDIMGLIAHCAAMASINLAREKGAFPLFDAELYHNDTVPHLESVIKECGIRNALLTSIAPTGTISLYAGNVSSGVEPIFATEYKRKVLQKDGTKTEEIVMDYAVMDHARQSNEPLPKWFVTAQNIKPEAHVNMQAAAQKYVDNAISKTINVPIDISFDDFKDVYMQAWEQGCKGCTTYRPNDVTGSVLEVVAHAEGDGGACTWDPATGERSCAG